MLFLGTLPLLPEEESQESACFLSTSIGYYGLRALEGVWYKKTPCPQNGVRNREGFWRKGVTSRGNNRDQEASWNTRGIIPGKYLPLHRWGLDICVICQVYYNLHKHPFQGISLWENLTLLICLGCPFWLSANSPNSISLVVGGCWRIHEKEWKRNGRVCSKRFRRAAPEV